MTEEPASQEEQPMQVPATAIPTPEVTAVPEDTPALAPEATPEPAVPEEGTAAPEMTGTPEATAAPEATEPTEVHDPLVLSLTTDVRSAFADGNAIDVMLLIEGGVLDAEAEAVRDRLDAVPGIEEIMAMTVEEHGEYLLRLNDIYDAYLALIEEQRRGSRARRSSLRRCLRSSTGTS